MECIDKGVSDLLPFTQQKDGRLQEYSMGMTPDTSIFSEIGSQGNQVTQDEERLRTAGFAHRDNTRLISVSRRESLPHPSMAHIERSGVVVESWPNIDEKLKHLDSMQPITKAQTKHQMLKLPTPETEGARDSSRPLGRVSLSATHPSNYGPRDAQTMPQLPTPPSERSLSLEQFMSQISSPIAPISTPSPIPPCSVSLEPPWRVHTDPMWQTSTDPHFWERNHTILRCDRRLEPGNVISPTFMVGLPCGGMVEMAHYYRPTSPENERGDDL